MEPSKLYSNEGEELNFSIFRADNTKTPSIIKAYLKVFLLTEEDLEYGYIEDEDIAYPLYHTAEIRQAMRESLWPIRAIVSLQIHTWGKAAVARLYKDMKGAY